MGGQRFWLVKVTHLSQRHITLWYYGDKFLAHYSLLMNKDNNKRHEFKHRRDAITILHWNIRLTSTGQGKSGGASVCWGPKGPQY